MTLTILGVVAASIGLTAVLVRLGLNGVRACAALSIIGYHALTSASGFGIDLEALRTGVLVFFALSGFLLFRPFASALQQGSPLDLRRYALSRAFRVLPLFVLVFTLVFVRTGWPLGAW